MQSLKKQEVSHNSIIIIFSVKKIGNGYSYLKFSFSSACLTRSNYNISLLNNVSKFVLLEHYVLEQYLLKQYIGMVIDITIFQEGSTIFSNNMKSTPRDSNGEHRDPFHSLNSGSVPWLKKKKISAQHILIHLFNRSIQRNHLTHKQDYKKFYQVLTPNFTVCNIKKPAGLFRKFSPCGR